MVSLVITVVSIDPPEAGAGCHPLTGLRRGFLSAKCPP